MGCGKSLQNIGSLTYFSLYGIKTRGTITRIVDGDTFDMAIQVNTRDMMTINGKTPILTNNHTIFTSLYRCRLANMDAAEKKTDKGKLAIAYLTNICESQKYIFDCTLGKYDKYGRLLITIYTNDGLDISELMISHPSGFALPYDGKTKKAIL